MLYLNWTDPWYCGEPPIQGCQEKLEQDYYDKHFRVYADEEVLVDYNTY